MKNKALVIGLYVNGYGIIRELSRDSEIPIVGLDHNPKSFGFASKHLSEKYVLGNNESLIDFLLDYGKKQEYKVVLFPTTDYHTKIFARFYDELSQYYHIPVNPNTLLNTISKKHQYEICEKIGIPYPKTFFVESISDINDLDAKSKELMYPLIVKPFYRDNDVNELFRLKEIRNQLELQKCLTFIRSNINKGFMVSEVVLGEPDNIWAYTAYCNQNSDIVAGWTGRKLTQKPYYYGVFSTARCELNPVVESQGEKFLKEIEHIGIGEPEFKYDHRDDTYKFIEINPRYMMWHLLGWKGGINLPLIQYYDMTDQRDKLNYMKKSQNINHTHLVFLPHEIYNLIYDKPTKKFAKNILNALLLRNKIWAVWNLEDPLPAIKLFFMLFKRWN